METCEQLKNILIESIKNAKETKMIADDLISEIEARIWDEIEIRPSAGRIKFGKMELGQISKDAFDYFQSIKQNEFKTDLHWNDFYNTDMIFETIHGYLVISEKFWGLGSEMADDGYFVSWYPVGYENYFEQKSKTHWEDGDFTFLIVETEGFKTPRFMLHPEKIPGYCVSMAKQGFSLMEDFEYRDFGWKYDLDEHDMDFVKEV